MRSRLILHHINQSNLLIRNLIKGRRPKCKWAGKQVGNHEIIRNQEITLSNSFECSGQWLELRDWAAGLGGAWLERAVTSASVTWCRVDTVRVMCQNAISVTNNKLEIYHSVKLISCRNAVPLIKQSTKGKCLSNYILIY